MSVLSTTARGAALFALALPVAARGLDACELELTTERVVVFKDGYALVVRRAYAVPDKNGRVYTEEVPDSAALGCFWASFVDDDPGAARIGAMHARWIEEVLEPGDPVACRSLAELLEANQGQSVRLQLRAAEEPDLAGTIVEVLTEAGLVVLERETQSKAGHIALPIAAVHSIVSNNLATTLEPTPGTLRKKRLSFDLTLADGPYPASEPVELRLFYFTPGVRWIPTYRLSGELETEGGLALQAEILNELEDIEEAEFDLVVGVPNFRFKSVISPLTLERAMQNSLAQAAPQLMGQSNPLSNALFSQRSGEHMRAAADVFDVADPQVGDIAPELGATGEQDLFVYNAGRLSLAKGARATINLWELEVPIEPLYTLDLDVVRGSESQAYLRNSGTQQDSPLQLAENPVWHQLRLQNGSSFPWTTGPALLLRGLIPLGQELLTYTPRGAQVMVPVTVAVDVQGRSREQQLQREEDAVRRNGHSYDRVTKRMTVEVTNFRTETAELHIQVGLGGEVTRASEGAQVVLGEPRGEDWQQQHQFGHALNPHSEVLWELTLDPGETRMVELDFVLYVR